MYELLSGDIFKSTTINTVFNNHYVLFRYFFITDNFPNLSERTIDTYEEATHTQYNIYARTALRRYL